MTGLLQTAGQVAERSRMLESIDPHGIIISIISIAGVFFALYILYLAYTVIGICVSKLEERKILKELPVEGVSTGPEKEAHDKESYRITIARKPKTVIHMPDAFTALSEIYNDETEDGSMEKKVVIHESGIVRAPLPGVITDLKVNVGDKVSIGKELAVLEAMKMENTIEAEQDGTVTEIYISKGESVLEGRALIKIQ